MTKSAFDKIAEGMNEALAVARGEAEPARTNHFVDATDMVAGRDSERRGKSQTR
jgi:hypothetical protein